MRTDGSTLTLPVSYPSANIQILINEQSVKSRYFAMRRFIAAGISESRPPLFSRKLQMSKNNNSSQWGKKEMNKGLFVSHTVGHLETLMKLEVGGLPRMLVCFSLVEFGGRAFAAKKEDYVVSDSYKGFFKLMFKKIKESTGNKLYQEEDVVNALYDGWRNGLAHLLVPTKDFSIGDGTEQRNNHMKKEKIKLLFQTSSLLGI